MEYVSVLMEMERKAAYDNRYYGLIDFGMS